MKCPKCDKEGLKYTDDRNDKHYIKAKKDKRNDAKKRKISNNKAKNSKIKERTEFVAKCKHCGYEGKT